MKITKTQLQEIIREEINALSEDEQLDELFGFSKKEKMAKFRAKLDKDNADIDKRGDEEWEKHKGSDEYKAQSDKESAEYDERQASSSRKRNKASDARAKERKGQAAFDSIGREADSENRRSAKNIRRGAAAGGMRGSSSEGGRYAANRKDESQLRKRIKEEVSKALKANFTFKK